MRLLLVEDEPKLAGMIEKGLADEAFVVETVPDGEQALVRARRTAFDLIILDLMLPGIGGLDVCRELRALGTPTPILMLSARRLVEDRVKGLEFGADDYLTKPFAFSELVARIRALIRRRKPGALLNLTIGDLTLDPIARVVKRGERRVDLSQREFALLDYLMRHAGQAVTRAMIAEQVWDFNSDRFTNVIDVYINHLRNKLERATEPRLIHAVRGVGYVIRETDETG